MRFRFEDMKPEDGFNAFVSNDVLVFDLTYKGDTIWDCVLASQGDYGDAGPFAASQLERLSYLAEAVAEFLNAGGTVDEITGLLEQLTKDHNFDTHSPVLDFGPYQYLRGFSSDMGHHIFMNPETGQCVEWDRYMFIDMAVTAEDCGVELNGIATNTVDVYREDIKQAGQTDGSIDILPGA